MMEQLTDTIKMLLQFSSIDKSSTDLFHRNRMARIEKPTLANLCELLVCLITKQANEQVAENLFNVAFTFSVLDQSKKANSPYVSSFISTSDRFLNVPSKIGGKQNQNKLVNIVLQALAQNEITEKSHRSLTSALKSVLVNEQTFRKEMGTLCMMIVLSCIQNRKSFNDVRARFKKVSRTSLFVRKLKLGNGYITTLKPLVAEREVRRGFGTQIIETLNNYAKKNKMDIESQYQFAQLIKSLFYLSKHEVLHFLDKVYDYLKAELFAIGVQVLSDNETEDEIQNWLPPLWKVYNERNEIKKRLIVCYQSLIDPQTFDGDLTMRANAKTVSFFVGLSGQAKHAHKIDESIINASYYALGVQLRNSVYLNTIKSSIEICIKRQIAIPPVWLHQVLSDLSDTIYPNKYRQGVQLLSKCRPTFGKVRSLRNSILQVNDQIELLSRIDTEFDVIKRNFYFIQFLDMLQMFDRDEHDEGISICDNEKTMYTDRSNFSSADLSVNALSGPVDIDSDGFAVSSLKDNNTSHPTNGQSTSFSESKQSIQLNERSTSGVSSNDGDEMLELSIRGYLAHLEKKNSDLKEYLHIPADD